MKNPNTLAAAKLRTAFDLFVAGERMMRQTLKRRDPDASEEKVEERLQAWLQERPGAEHGDGVGRPVQWPRERPAVTSNKSSGPSPKA